MIRIFGNNECADCKTAKSIADDYNLRWTFFNIDEAEHFYTLKSLVGEDVSCVNMPQIFWGNTRLNGLSEFLTEIEETRNYGDGTI